MMPSAHAHLSMSRAFHRSWRAPVAGFDVLICLTVASALKLQLTPAREMTWAAPSKCVFERLRRAVARKRICAFKACLPPWRLNTVTSAPERCVLLGSVGGRSDARLLGLLPRQSTRAFRRHDAADSLLGVSLAAAAADSF